MEYPPPTCNSPLARAVGNAWAFPVEASESSDAREPTIIQFLSIPYSWKESKLPSCHISSTIGATSKAGRPFARLLREQTFLLRWRSRLGRRGTCRCRDSGVRGRGICRGRCGWCRRGAHSRGRRSRGIEVAEFQIDGFNLKRHLVARTQNRFEAGMHLDHLIGPRVEPQEAGQRHRRLLLQVLHVQLDALGDHRLHPEGRILVALDEGIADHRSEERRV